MMGPFSSRRGVGRPVLAFDTRLSSRSHYVVYLDGVWMREPIAAEAGSPGWVEIIVGRVPDDYEPAYGEQVITQDGAKFKTERRAGRVVIAHETDGR